MDRARDDCRRNRFFANWADVPSVVRLPDGAMVAHWLQVSGPGKYSCDVMLRHSPDDGRTWSAPLTPHHDGTETEHGFVVSIVPWPGSVFGSSFGVVWLDGRDFANHPGGEAGMKAEMALRAIVIPGGCREHRRKRQGLAAGLGLDAEPRGGR